MRNKKLFILISITLVLSLVLIGCGQKSQVEEGGEIEREDIIVEENNVETPR